jgi:hypothetical protein
MAARANPPRFVRKLRGFPLATVGIRRYRGRSMISTALRPVGHLAAWLVWHSTGISLLADLDAPAAPRSQ